MNHILHHLILLCLSTAHALDVCDFRPLTVDGIFESGGSVYAIINHGLGAVKYDRFKSDQVVVINKDYPRLAAEVWRQLSGVLGKERRRIVGAFHRDQDQDRVQFVTQGARSAAIWTFDKQFNEVSNGGNSFGDIMAQFAPEQHNISKVSIGDVSNWYTYKDMKGQVFNTIKVDKSGKQRGEPLQLNYGKGRERSVVRLSADRYILLHGVMWAFIDKGTTDTVLDSKTTPSSGIRFRGVDELTGCAANLCYNFDAHAASARPAGVTIRKGRWRWSAPFMADLIYSKPELVPPELRYPDAAFDTGSEPFVIRNGQVITVGSKQTRPLRDVLVGLDPNALKQISAATYLPGSGTLIVFGGDRWCKLSATGSVYKNITDWLPLKGFKGLATPDAAAAIHGTRTQAIFNGNYVWYIEDDALDKPTDGHALQAPMLVQQALFGCDVHHYGTMEMRVSFSLTKKQDYLTMMQRPASDFEPIKLITPPPRDMFNTTDTATTDGDQMTTDGDQMTIDGDQMTTTSKPPKNNTMTIVLSVIGALLLLVVIVIVVCCCLKSDNGDKQPTATRRSSSKSKVSPKKTPSGKSLGKRRSSSKSLRSGSKKSA